MVERGSADSAAKEDTSHVHERNELETEETTLSQTNEQQLVDSARAREVQWQFGVEDQKGMGKTGQERRRPGTVLETRARLQKYERDDGRDEVELDVGFDEARGEGERKSEGVAIQ